MSESLTEFLLARIAEDEDEARRAAFGYGASWTNETDDAEDWSVVHADGKRDMVGCEDRDVTGHIARHDPARVLVECEAKRRIVRAYRAAEMDRAVWSKHPDSTGYARAVARVSAWTYALQSLAGPCADHPDYREEWKP